MKKFAILALTAFTGVSLFGAAFARIDVDGFNVKPQVKIEPAKQKTLLNTRHIQNLQQKPYRLTSDSPKKLTAEWTKVDMAFTAVNDGKVSLSFRGQWASKAADRAFVRYSDIKVNGKLVPNGDLTKSYMSPKLKKLMPNNFWIGEAKAKYIAKGGPDGKSGAVEVNHDNPASHALTVKAGETYVVEAMVQAAPAAAKAPVQK